MEALVVGGGPAGLTTALALARRGIASTVLEARPEPTDVLQSRAITWMPRGLDVADGLGVLAEIDAASVRRLRHRFATRGGATIATADFTGVPGRFRYTAQIPQGATERLLERAAARTGLVQVVRGARVLAVQGSHAGVTAEAVVAGESRVFAAAWGVAADGAGSPVRRALGIPLSTVDYGAHSVVADFVGSAGLPVTESVLVLDARRPHGLFPIAGDRWRLVYRVNRDEDPDRAASAEAAARHLAELFPAATASDVTWSSAFRLRQSDAAAYVQGRWVLVGDAAHPMGPSAGAGMMLGVLGAWRLGWALAGGDGAGGDLASYEREQRAAAARVQRSNARIFRQLAVRSPLAGALRARGLRVAARLTQVERRMAADEALVHEPLPELPDLPGWADGEGEGARSDRGRRHGLRSAGDAGRGHARATSSPQRGRVGV